METQQRGQQGKASPGRNAEVNGRFPLKINQNTIAIVADKKIHRIARPEKGEES
jgi:hypothetical protein